MIGWCKPKTIFEFIKICMILSFLANSIWYIYLKVENKFPQETCQYL
jgi:hypothetical protein